MKKLASKDTIQLIIYVLGILSAVFLIAIIAVASKSNASSFIPIASIFVFAYLAWITVYTTLLVGKFDNEKALLAFYKEKYEGNVSENSSLRKEISKLEYLVTTQKATIESLESQVEALKVTEVEPEEVPSVFDTFDTQKECEEVSAECVIEEEIKPVQKTAAKKTSKKKKS